MEGGRLTRYDYLREVRPQLEELAAHGVAREDLRDLIIYEDIERLRSDGLKMDYCVAYAGERYGRSESSVWRLVRRMREQL